MSGGGFLMTIDDKTFSFSFVSVRSAVFLAFSSCERSMRFCKQLPTQANASELGLADSTHSVYKLCVINNLYVTAWRNWASLRRKLARRQFAKRLPEPSLLSPLNPLVTSPPIWVGRLIV